MPCSAGPFLSRPPGFLLVSYSTVPLASSLQASFKFWVGGKHMVGIGQGKEEEE
jgi:hypothetical protein